MRYVVTEYVQGVSLDKLFALPRGGDAQQLPVELAVELAIDVCAALEHAHTPIPNSSRGPMIHGSLAAKKIMISKGGVAKVLGFGNVQRPAGIQDVPSYVRASKLAYVSPEQLRGDTPDEQTDIYSVGLLLYEALAGQPPYRGHSAYHLMRRIMEGNPRGLRAEKPALSTELEATVLRAIHVDQESRPRSVSELRRELEDEVARHGRRTAAGHSRMSMLTRLLPDGPWDGLPITTQRERHE
jgi:serine/threonine-protein kinase